MAAASITLIGLGILSGMYAASRSSENWSLRHAVPGTTGLPPSSSLRNKAPSPTTLLVLGGVPVQSHAADHYELSVRGETFLTLDSLRTGLQVTCDLAGSQVFPLRIPRLAASIRRNVVVFRGPGVSTSKPDANSFLAQENGTDILRIRFVDLHRIDVSGRFYLSAGTEPRMITLVHGIRWPGGAVPYGSGIDLRPQGPGRIEFARSGEIEVLGK